MPCGLHCNACDFCSTSFTLNNLLGTGPLNADIMFVGQNPGPAEEIALEPLAGETGVLFDDFIKEINLTRHEVRITNAIRCRPPQGVKAAARHINACRQHLANEILQVKPKVIVAMGAVALESLLGFNGITSVRGHFFKTKTVCNIELDYEVIVYCMLMPAALFRRWEDYPIVLEDFRTLGRKIKYGWNEGGLGDYRVTQTPQEVEQIVNYLIQQPRFSFDLETTSYDFYDFNLCPTCNILCVSLSALSGSAFVVPLLQQHAHPYWSAEDWASVWMLLNKLFESNTPKWAQNGMFDINFLRANGFRFNLDSFTFDTLLAHHTLQENTAHDLDTLCSLFTQLPLYSHALTVWKKQNGGIKSYADFPNNLLWPYAGADADATIRVGDVLTEQLQQECTVQNKEGVSEPIPLMQFFEEVVMPLNRALIDIKYHGIVVDTETTLKLNAIELKTEAKYEEQFYELLGRKINLRSTQQLQAALFNSPEPPTDPNMLGCNGKAWVPGFGLPVIATSPSSKKPSTNAEEVLVPLYEQTKHPALKALSEARKCQKKISTYLAGRDNKSGILKSVIPSTGRLHADFKQHTVVTGRLASFIHTIPNPDKDPEYAKLRTVFTVPDGWWMLQNDFSQLELRIVATIAPEKRMLDAFASGKDIHQWTASEIYEIPYDDVTKSQRKRAKDINFGLLYGKGVHSLAQDLGMSNHQAEDFLAAYFRRFPDLAAYFERTKASLRDTNFITNEFGRKRRLYGYKFLSEAEARRFSCFDDYFLKQCAARRKEMERQAINFGVQSTGSDVLSLATARIHKRLRGMQSAIIISHHDALYVETPPEELFEAAYILVEEMEAPVPQLYNRSFPTDLKVGKNWGEVNKEVTEQVLEYIKQRRTA